MSVQGQCRRSRIEHGWKRFYGLLRENSQENPLMKPLKCFQRYAAIGENNNFSILGAKNCSRTEIRQGCSQNS